MKVGTNASVPGEAHRASDASARVYRALGARSWDEALRIVEQNWSQLLASGAPALRAVVATVPRDRLAADPRWTRARAYIGALPAAAPSPAPVHPDALAEVVRLTTSADRERRTGSAAGALALTRRARSAYDAVPSERRGGLRGDLPRMLLAWGLAEFRAGDLATAQEDLTRAYSAARAVGDPQAGSVAAAELAWLHAAEGRPSARTEWAAIARSLAPRGVPGGAVPAALLLAEALAALDALDLAGARVRLEAAARAPGDHAFDVEMLSALVDAKDPAADPRARCALLESGATSSDDVALLALADAAQACALLHTGSSEQARRLLTTLPVPAQPATRALRAVAHLVQGDLDHALRDAQAALHDLGRPRVVVEACAVAAAVHLRRRDDETAPTFRRAVALADAHGLPCALTQIPQGDFDALAIFAPEGSPSMAVIASTPVRRPPAPRVAGVRATEHEIAAVRLLAAGRSVAQAAAELGVSTNTVKTLTRRIYAKLGVSDRRQMTAAASEHGLL
ncbi:LuxR C-terminal-related transcriptional regulator [Microbacterium sp. NPDC055683]